MVYIAVRWFSVSATTDHSKNRIFFQNSLLIHGKGEAPETQEQFVNLFFPHATGVWSVYSAILFQLIEVIGFKCWVMFLRKGVNGVSCI